MSNREDAPLVEHHIAVGEASLAYLTLGAGPAVVIVHGVGGHKEDWVVVMQALADHYTVYAIDMLGFGGSSRDAMLLDMNAQAAAVRALLMHEEIPSAAVIGNSVGGWVAATFAATYPQMIDQLVLVDPAGFAAMFEGEPPVNLFPDNIAEMTKLLSFVLASEFAHTEEFASEALRRLDENGERSIVSRLWPALLGSARLEAVLPRVTAETLVLWGAEDRLFPVALAPYITGLLPNASSEIIPSASHFPQIDNAPAFIAAVRAFLKP